MGRTVLWLLVLLSAGLVAAPARASGVAISGGSLFYREAGSGPPVIMLHGYMHVGTVWEPYVEKLASTHRVIVFDLPGHGRSDRLHPEFSHERVALSMLGALDSLRISSAYLVGHSSGALIALHMALLRPDRISALVAIATPWRVPDSLREAAKDVSVEGSPVQMLDALRAWHPGGLSQIKWLLDQQRHLAAVPRDMALTDDKLRRIEVPTLVVHGDRDRMLPVAGALELAEVLPQASLLVVPDARHEFIIDGDLASRLLLSALLDFLEH